MDLDTWVSLAVIVSTGIATIGTVITLDTLMLRAIGKLDTKVDAARKEAKTDNENLRTYVEQAFGRVETRLTSLEQRTYDIKPT